MLVSLLRAPFDRRSRWVHVFTGAPLPAEPNADSPGADSKKDSTDHDCCSKQDCTGVEGVLTQRQDASIGVYGVEHLGEHLSMGVLG
jgi:hypothetical protein